MNRKNQFLNLAIGLLLLSMVLHIFDQIRTKMGFHIDANLVLPTIAIFCSLKARSEVNKPG